SLGSWTLAGTEYKVAYAVKTTTSQGETLFIFSDVVLQGADPKANTVAISFKTPPTASGSYELVSSGSSSLTSNQFKISAGSSAASYAYIGAATAVQLTVANGKIQVTLPEITVKSTSSLPDAKLSASLKEM